MSIRIGVDLGGTKIEVIALDQDGRCLMRERIATPQGDYAATLRATVGLIELLESSVGAGAECRLSTADPLHRRKAVLCETPVPPPLIGVGIPGCESSETGLVKNANSTCLNGRPLRQDLQALLGREARLANDANCFALSEATDGAGAGAAVVFGVILGTGVGGGMAIHGQVLTGINGIAGEWGHNPLAEFAREVGDHERPCYCGRKHCIELYLSGPGMMHDHSFSTHGESKSVAEIVAAASTGDAVCEATLQRYEQRLARALAGVINILDPDVIVLGGGLSNIDRLYETVPRLWEVHVFSDTVKTRLVKPVHGDSSGVRGAAWL